MIAKGKYLKKKAQELRKEIITMSFKGQRAHISSCLSIAEILTVLYFDILKLDPEKPDSPNRDKFILSKGHAACALYAILAQRGFFPKKYLATYGQENTQLGQHPEYGTIPGIELSTGSLGHGLPVGAGMALATKLNSYQSKIYVLLSDAECDVGSTWEAILFASHHKLDNLIAIVDYNKLQAFGRTRQVLNLEPFSKKWISFGWTVLEVDGHNPNKLSKAFKTVPKVKNRPTVLIAHTVAGRGVSFLENKLEWHYLNLDKTQYSQALEEINNS